MLDFSLTCRRPDSTPGQTQRNREMFERRVCIIVILHTTVTERAFRSFLLLNEYLTNLSDRVGIVTDPTEKHWLEEAFVTTLPRALVFIEFASRNAPSAARPSRLMLVCRKSNSFKRSAPRWAGLPSPGSQLSEEIKRRLAQRQKDSSVPDASLP